MQSLGNFFPFLLLTLRATQISAWVSSSQVFPSGYLIFLEKMIYLLFLQVCFCGVFFVAVCLFVFLLSLFLFLFGVFMVGGWLGWFGLGFFVETVMMSLPAGDTIFFNSVS